MLIYEGDTIENIYYLVSGYVKVFNISDNGAQRAIIIYKPGDTFPLVSFLSGGGIARYFYECQTNVEVKSQPQAEFQKLIKGNLELGEELIAYSYKMSLQFEERIETLSASSARAKVVSLLQYLANKTGEEQGDKIVLGVPLTSREIAEMCGLTRETASLHLLKLKSEGVVSGRRYLSIDKRKLAQLNRTH
jgi:CRP/FNR family transcriptional regulator, cyclic AMP receptor protein